MITCWTSNQTAFRVSIKSLLEFEGVTVWIFYEICFTHLLKKKTLKHSHLAEVPVSSARFLKTTWVILKEMCTQIRADPEDPPWHRNLILTNFYELYLYIYTYIYIYSCSFCQHCANHCLISEIFSLHYCVRRPNLSPTCFALVQPYQKQDW